MKKIMLGLAAAVLSSVGFAANYANWFFADCQNDPTDIAYKMQIFGGGWLSPTTSRHTEPVFDWDEWMVSLSGVPQSAPVTYQADWSTNSIKGDICFSSELVFSGCDTLPPIDADAKAGVCALNDDNFHVVGFDSVSRKNCWIDTGIPTDCDNRISLQTIVATNTVRYCFYCNSWDDDGIHESSSYDIEAVINGGEFQRVCFSGTGGIISLTGNFDRYLVTGHELVLPEVQGLMSYSDPDRADPGEEVTVYFQDDTRIAGVSSAVYIVQEVDEDTGKCSLELKEGENVPYSIAPGACLGSKLYRTYDLAYADAVDGDSITIYTDVDLATNLIDKSVMIDIFGNNFQVDRDLEISGACLKIIDSSSSDAGANHFKVKTSNITVDLDATLDLSEVDIRNQDVDGVVDMTQNGRIVLNGRLVVADIYLSANYFYSYFADVFAGKAIPDDGVVVVGSNSYTGDPSADPVRFVIDDEIAYAMVDEMGYLDSFASVQDALDVASDVYLLGETDEDVVFRRGNRLFAQDGQMTGELLPPRGYTVEYSDVDNAYVLMPGDPVEVTINPPADPVLFRSYTIYTNSVLAVEGESGVVVFDDLYVDDEISITVDYVDPDGAVSCPDYSDISGLSVEEIDGVTMKFLVLPEVTGATVTVAEPEIYYLPYEITYSLGGGFWKPNYAPRSEFTINDATFSLPVGSDIDYPGHEFLGWYSNSSFDGDAVTQIAKGSTGDKTFYARWGLVKVAIILPTISGLSNSCDVVEAYPGDKVTVRFFSDTRFASRDSAQYTVQDNGTLLFSDTGSAPTGIEPAARIGTVIYRTFEDAYAAANEGDAITIGSDTHTTQSLVITNSVTVDFVANSVYFDRPVLVTNDARLTVTTSAQYGGSFGLNALFTVAEGSELDCSDLAVLGYGGIDIGDGGRLELRGTVRFNNEGVFAGNTANKFFFNDCPGLLDGVGIVDGGVAVIGGLTFVGDSEGGRYVVEDEVAFAVPNEYDYEYVESYDSVQSALNAASNVTLTVATYDKNLLFPVGRRIYADDGALTGFLTPPSGYMVEYDSDEDAYVLVEFHAEHTVTFDFFGFRDEFVCENIVAGTSIGDVFFEIYDVCIPYGYEVEGVYWDEDCEYPADVDDLIDNDYIFFVVVVKSGDAGYPSYIPEDDGVKSDYDDWAAEYGPDTEGTNVEAFLLDCDPADVSDALAEFVITDFRKVDDEWVISIAGKEVKDGGRYGNGYVNIVTVPIAGASANSEFFKATLTVLPIN